MLPSLPTIDSSTATLSPSLRCQFLKSHVHCPEPPVTWLHSHMGVLPKNDPIYTRDKIHWNYGRLPAMRRPPSQIFKISSLVSMPLTRGTKQTFEGRTSRTEPGLNVSALWGRSRSEAFRVTCGRTWTRHRDNNIAIAGEYGCANDGV